MKTCKRCEEEKPEEDFYKNRGKVAGICKKCTYKRIRAKILEDPQKNRDYQRGWNRKRAHINNPKRLLKYHLNRDNEIKRTKEYRRKLKKDTMNAYGGSCDCCGESNIEFLAIDHVDGGGAEERRRTGKKGTSFYIDLKRRGYPKEYRVLCHNCNQSMGMYGYCPHSTPRPS